MDSGRLLKVLRNLNLRPLSRVLCFISTLFGILKQCLQDNFEIGTLI